MRMAAPNGKPFSRRWQFGDCEYLELSRTLMVNGQVVRMEAKPLDVLLQLLEASNQVVGKEQLLNSVWSEVKTTDQSLATAISKLRKAFGDSRDSVIINVAGIGYRIAVPVTCVVQETGLPPLALEPGASIPYRPHWIAVRKLSENDLSPVWLARHEKTGEERVYKFASDGVRLRALQREVAIFRLLTNSLGNRAEFLVRLLDWNFEEPPFFLESEYCGLNLFEWSKQPSFQRTTLEQRVQIAAYLAASVALAHTLAVFHNDLKPSNILITPARDDSESHSPASAWNIRIADFGVASLPSVDLLQQFDISDLESLKQDPAQFPTPVGTAMYRAPELHFGAAPTALTDIYSLGVLLYQLVSANFHEPPSPGWEQNVPDELLREDIAHAANLDPALRMRSVADLADRLQHLEQRRDLRRKAELTEIDRQKAQEALARARMRRPWLIVALASLIVAVGISLAAAFHAIHDRNAAREQTATLQSMYDFLALDLLGQSNPYLGVAGSGTAPQQTLIDAIAMAVPQIDSRFAHQPEIAGRLHATIADSLKSRSRFLEADREYAIAAQHFRQAEGSLSKEAIVVELKREFAAISSMRPGAIAKAQMDFAGQEKLISQQHQPSPELQSWKTLVQTALIGMGPHPEQSLPLLKAALQQTQAAPGFDRNLQIRLLNQYCGAYVRLGDGPNLERVSRQIIQLLTDQHGSASATLLPYQMYLEEAFYLQGKYPETIAQADRNFARFDRILGRNHRLTLSTLATRAAAEGQLERYADASRDDLTLYNAARLTHLDPRLEEGSLVDAASYECRQGEFQSGIAHARQVLRETGAGPVTQPNFYNGAMFTLAECILGEQEVQPPARRNPKSLQEVESLLHRVDVRQMAETSDQTLFDGPKSIALARLALLQKNVEAARQHLSSAQALLAHRELDPFERRALERVRIALSRNSP